jgi:predicted phosphodiesterase
MRARRVAVLADVHGNAVALAAVLNELEREQPDAIVHCGDLTWGPLPAETYELLAGRGVLFVRGNADRAVTELAERLQDPGSEATPRERWLVEHHEAPLRLLLAAFPETVELEVDGLGDVLFCHGSPRSDEELVTVETPESRLAEAVAGTSAGFIATAHTHVRYERHALGRTLFNPGSVGMPYEGEPGAYWAMLGSPGASGTNGTNRPNDSVIEHRRTAYDLDETERRYRASGDPLTNEMIDVLRHPPTPAQVIAHAESLAFSG